MRVPADGVLSAAALAVHLWVVDLEVNSLQRQNERDTARRGEEEKKKRGFEREMDGGGL